MEGDARPPFSGRDWFGWKLKVILGGDDNDEDRSHGGALHSSFSSFSLLAGFDVALAWCTAV
jgi:hypothetical protein